MTPGILFNVYTMISHTPATFAKLLRHHRGTIPVRALGEQAQVPHSLIVALENQKRSAGPKTAKKLADALKLEGQQRDEFLEAAKHTSQRNRLSNERRLKSNFEQVVFSFLSSLQGLTRSEIREVIACKNSLFDLIAIRKDDSAVGFILKHQDIKMVSAPSVDRLYTAKDVSDLKFKKTTSTILSMSEFI